MLYLWHAVHDLFAWQHAESAWHRAFHPDGPARALYSMAIHPAVRYPMLANAIFCAIDLGALALAWRARVPRAWIAFGAVAVILPTFSGTFLASARYALFALPVYWGLAHLGRDRRIDRAIRAVSPPLLAAGIVSVLYWFRSGSAPCTRRPRAGWDVATLPRWLAPGPNRPGTTRSAVEILVDCSAQSCVKGHL
jgi:hypothetical protein